MFLKRIMKYTRFLRWSTFLPIVLYFIFMAVIINFTFPINSPSSSSTSSSVDSKNAVEQFIGSKRNKTAAAAAELLELETVILANSINEKYILKYAFKNADENSDSYLSIQELARYISKKIHDHIDNAIKMNPINFSQIDQTPRDGLISWEEYHAYFLREHGLDEKYIREHNEKKHIKLDRKSKEEMMRDKALWAEAARTDPFSLTLDEFLAFRHPESSAVNLLSLVDDLLRQFDIDGDDHLTLEEFSDVTTDEGDKTYRKSIISKTMEERKEEFKRIVDKNKDGKADRAELLTYVDPRHPRYALQEAATLINLTDSNKDGKLSLGEVLVNANIFMTSKMIDTSNSFHDEF